MEQGGEVPVELRVARTHDDHRRARAVLRRVPDLLHEDVAAVVVRAGRLDPLPLVRLEVQAIAGLRHGEGGQREHGAVLAQPAQRGGVVVGEWHFAHLRKRRSRFLSRLEDEDPGGDIGQQIHVGAVADRRVALEEVILLGDQVSPAGAVRPVRQRDPLGGDLHDPIERGIEVGPQQQAAVLVPGACVGSLAREDRVDLTGGAIHDEDVVPHPAVLDAEEQQVSVPDLLDAEEGLGAVAVSENVLVLVARGPEAVVAGSRAVLPRTVDVEETLSLAVERDGSVERLGEPIGALFQHLQVEEPYMDLVEPAVADGIEEERSVG